MPIFMFLSIFSWKQTEKHTNSIGSNSDQNISLIIYSKFFSHVEDFIGFEENVLIL